MEYKLQKNILKFFDQIQAGSGILNTGSVAKLSESATLIHRRHFNEENDISKYFTLLAK